MSIYLQSQCNGTIQEIADIVRELRIVHEDRLITGEVSIFSDRECREEIEREHITRILSDICNWIDHIADRF